MSKLSFLAAVTTLLTLVASLPAARFAGAQAEQG